MILATWLFCIATANRLIEQGIWRAAAVLALTFVACAFLIWVAQQAGWWFRPYRAASAAAALLEPPVLRARAMH